MIYGSPGAGSFGTVLSGSLELSTVDLATEFVKMVTTQRGFQASSRTITVTDTLLEEVGTSSDKRIVTETFLPRR